MRKVNHKKDSEVDEDDALISEINLDINHNHEEMDMPQNNNNIRLLSDDVQIENTLNVNSEFQIDTRTKSQTFKFDSMKRTLVNTRKISES